MKKLLLALVIMLCSITSFSQSEPLYKKITTINRLEFVEGEFINRETIRPENYYIKIDGYKVYINGEKIITHGDMTTEYHEGFVSYSWKCVDKDGKEGYFIMKSFSKYEGTVMMLGFGNWCLEFYAN